MAFQSEINPLVFCEVRTHVSNRLLSFPMLGRSIWYHKCGDDVDIVVLHLLANNSLGPWLQQCWIHDVSNLELMPPKIDVNLCRGTIVLSRWRWVIVVTMQFLINVRIRILIYLAFRNNSSNYRLPIIRTNYEEEMDGWTDMDWPLWYLNRWRYNMFVFIWPYKVLDKAWHIDIFCMNFRPL